MKKITGVILAGMIATAAVGASSAPAQIKEKQRITLHFLTVRGIDRPARLTAVGPISGHGTETQKAKPGNVYLVVLHLSRGTVRLTAAEGKPNLRPDFKKCIATVDSKGTFKITGGTGSFITASGHGTFVDHGTLTGSRDKAGRCQPHVPPIKRVDTLTMTGTASL
jgi:hypothetical protein